MKSICFALFLIFQFQFVLTQNLELLWATDAVIDVPESVVYDEVNQCLYAGNIVGSPWDEDGKGFISKLSINGEVIERNWVDGFSAPKGLAIKDGKLYIADMKDLVEVDIEKKKVIKRYTLPVIERINDVALGPDGRIYCTDSKLYKVYVFDHNKLMVFLDNTGLSYLNGLTSSNGDLILASKNILKVNVKTKQIVELIPDTGMGIDGIEDIGNGWFIITSWGGEVKMVNVDGKQVSLLNTRILKMNTADIGINRADKTVYMPTFYDKRVIAFKYSIN